MTALAPLGAFPIMFHKLARGIPFPFRHVAHGHVLSITSKSADMDVCLRLSGPVNVSATPKRCQMPPLTYVSSSIRVSVRQIRETHGRSRRENAIRHIHTERGADKQI